MKYYAVELAGADVHWLRCDECGEEFDRDAEVVITQDSGHTEIFHKECADARTG